MLPEWNWHDLRRTVRIYLSRLRVAPHVAESVLGHAITGLTKVYDLWDYADEKHAEMELRRCLQAVGTTYDRPQSGSADHGSIRCYLHDAASCVHGSIGDSGRAVVGRLTRRRLLARPLRGS
jgi:hypothetical protein